MSRIGGFQWQLFRGVFRSPGRPSADRGGEAAAGEIITISAADPLNLVGVVVPGEKTPAISGRFVSFRDGAIEESLAPKGREPIAHAG